MGPIEFIRIVRESFIGSVEVYTKGSCYQFFRILQAKYPKAEAYFNIDHVITKIDDKYYDITGEVTKTDRYLPMDKHFPSARTKTHKFDIYYYPKTY
mgnify:CR=1 FL=1